MNKLIIGLSGQQNAGKHTVASMISYILTVGITKAKFRNWVLKQTYYRDNHNGTIIDCDDNKKKAASIIFGIELDKFYSKEYMENLWYSINERRFLRENDIIPLSYFKVSPEHLEEQDFNYFCYNINANPLIKLKDLLNYFSNKLLRDKMYYEIWINSTMRTATDIANALGFAIINNMRGYDIINRIRSNSITGKTIYISRRRTDKFVNKPIEHDEHIENDSSFNVLFYRVIEILQSYMS